MMKRQIKRALSVVLAWTVVLAIDAVMDAQQSGAVTISGYGYRIFEV